MKSPYMSYGRSLGLEGPIGDYIGFLGGSIKGYTTNFVQGSYGIPLGFPCKFCVFRGPGIFGVLSFDKKHG